MGLRDNLRNAIADQQRAAEEAAEKAKQDASLRRARALDVAEDSFCRLLAEDSVQEIIEYHVKNIRGLQVVTIGCFDDKAVIYLDPESNVPRQHPLNLEFNAEAYVKMEAIQSEKVQGAIQILKREGVAVNAKLESRVGVVRITLDYRNV